MQAKKVQVTHPMMQEKKNPMSGGRPHLKTDFNTKNGLDHVENKHKVAPVPVGKYGSIKGTRKS